MASGKRENEAARGEEVDATVLQQENQRFVQQLEAQKSEVHTIERQYKELKDKQISYDDSLITVNKMWNQLVDDLILLGVRAGGDSNSLKALSDRSNETFESCPPDQVFLCRLLKVGLDESIGENGIVKFVQEALASRHASTTALMKSLQDTFASQRAKTEKLASILSGKISAEDAIIQLQKLCDSLKDEASNLSEAIDVLREKHKQYLDEINSYVESHSSDQAEIKRLSGELEENMAELEETRRKLVVLQVQILGTSMMHASIVNSVNGRNLQDKASDRAKSVCELKDSVEEAKTLAANRLVELQEAQEENLMLSKQLQALQNGLSDDRYITSSRPYTLLNDQLQHLNLEIEKYKGLMESFEADRSYLMNKENELNVKAELAEAAKSSISNSEATIKELELQIQKCICEKNDVEMQLEDAKQDLARKDIKDEIRVMASALSKEMEMMEAQLNRSKDIAYEARSLHEESSSLRSHLHVKSSEIKGLLESCTEQRTQIKSLKAMVDKLDKEKQEMLILLDMYVQECSNSRTIMEIKESEHRARQQAQYLQSSLDENSFELRVKAAKEAETACELRLSAAEAEIVDLRKKLDISERHMFELKEAIRVKDAEAEAYVSEIEAIGQAYEDMQMQNLHLTRQVADRDDCNIKLVSDNVKLRQTHSSLLSEKQVLSKQIQQVNGSLDFFIGKIFRAEEQMKAQFAQAVKTALDNRRISGNMDKVKMEVAHEEKELKWLRFTVESSEKEYEQNQNKIIEMRLELEKERNERKKLEEELAELKNEVIDLSPERQEEAIQKLQEEIKECKAILKCGVCFDRPKEVVITKCFHLFCTPCIQRNLEIRHRKCPGCGTPFGQNDVREVKI